MKWNKTITLLIILSLLMYIIELEKRVSKELQQKVEQITFSPEGEEKVFAVSWESITRQSK